MDRLELLGKIKKELKAYKEFLLNIIVVDNLNQENAIKDRIKTDEIVKKKTKER